MSEMDGGLTIAAFERTVTHVPGADAVPAAICGDLSDLLFTLEKGVKLLRDLVESNDQAQIARQLQDIEVLIEDDLGMISRDLLPALKTLRRLAYKAIE